MKQLEKILIPTDLSEYSRRAVVSGCWLASEQRASVMILHVANELPAWEFYSDEFSFVQAERKWPVDRVLAEASLDLSRFLEPSLAALKKCTKASKRVVLGPVAQANCRRRRTRKSRPGDHVAAPACRIAPLVFRLDNRSGYPFEPVPRALHRRAVAVKAVAWQRHAGIFQLGRGQKPQACKNIPRTN